MVGFGLTSATWLPLTMRLPPSTRPSGSRERRSSAFIREDSGIASSSAILEAVLDLAGHGRGTESRNQEDLGGPGRTRSRQQSNTSGHLGSREDTGGHVTNTLRDRASPTMRRLDAARAVCDT